MATNKEIVDSEIKSEEPAKTTEEKVAEAKAARKAATKKTVEATAAVVKDTAEKTAKKTKEAAKKGAEAAKASAKKTSEKAKTAVKEKAEAPKRKYTRKPAKKIMIQFLGQEISEEELTERALAQFAATEGAVAVKTITLYIKPEDNAAYYVINEQYTGKVDF